MVSAHGTATTALEAGRLGAFRFIEKPLSKDYVLDAVREGLELGTLRRENRTLRSALETRHQLVGESTALEADHGPGPPRGADQRDRADSWRERRRQGADRARDPPQQPARQGAVRAGQLRGDSRRADRVRALRPRARRVHRRDREADRQVRDGRPRHDLPRRSRRHERRRRRPRCCASCRKAKSSGSGSSRTIKVDVRVIAATNKDLEEEIAAGPVPRGSLFPAERDSDLGAAAARAARGHPGARPALRRAVQPREQPAPGAVFAQARSTRCGRRAGAATSASSATSSSGC